MARFLAIWRQNLATPGPEDPVEAYKLNEQIFSGVEDLMKKGEIEEFGAFVDGLSGYVISTGTAVDVHRRLTSFQPYFIAEVNEVIPYEQAKATILAIAKARIDQS